MKYIKTYMVASDEADEDTCPYFKDKDPIYDYDCFLRWKDLQKNNLILDESIREDTCSRFLKELRSVMSRSPQELTVYITSPGGGAYYALAIYDALRAVSSTGVTITAIVEGWAASAASMIILQAADHRIARPHARFLLHETRRWVFFSVEKTSELEEEVQEMKAIDSLIVNILANRCQKEHEEIKNFLNRKEVWMSAKEALDFHLIDSIS